MLAVPFDEDYSEVSFSRGVGGVVGGMEGGVSGWDGVV